MQAASTSEISTATDIQGKLAVLDKLVEDVYVIHDTFFSEDTAIKTVKLQEALKPVIELGKSLAAASVSGAQKAAVALLHGRALDALPAYNPEAEELLARAVKLEPSNVDAWNALGHCFWKKGDYGAAAGCYNDSHKRRPNSTALCALSQIVRHATNTAESRADSIAKAKAAVALDMKDPKSWSVLGAACLIAYIAGDRVADDLVKANKAYQKAAQLEAAAVGAAAGSSNSNSNSNSSSSSSSSASNSSSKETAPAGGAPASTSGSALVVTPDPDLHYNRASVLQYLEDFDDSIHAYETAVAIDPALKGFAAVESIRRHVIRTADLVAKRAMVKPRRLKEMAQHELQGALGGQEATLAGSRKAATIADLVPGPNPGKYLRLRCLLPVVKTDQQPPPCAIVLDAGGAAACLAVFHVTDAEVGRLDKDKHSLLLLDPMLKVVSVTLPHGHKSGGESSGDEGVAAAGAAGSGAPAAGEDKAAGAVVVSYPCLQVMAPESFAVDGKFISRTMVAKGSSANIEAFDR